MCYILFCLSLLPVRNKLVYFIDFFHTDPLIALIAVLLCTTITVCGILLSTWSTLQQREMVNSVESFIFRLKKRWIDFWPENGQ